MESKVTSHHEFLSYVMFLYNVMHFYMSAWFALLLLCFPSHGSFRDHSEAGDTPGPTCLMHGSQINSQILATIVQSLRAMQDVMSCISMAYHVISCHVMSCHVVLSYDMSVMFNTVSKKYAKENLHFERNTMSPRCRFYLHKW